MPIPDALEIAGQIADGLEAAHERGVIHRDLKPANIKLAANGVVKILDFGLAKPLAGSSPGLDPSLVTVEATRDGTVSGTAAYMSPEQARGQALDRRTDVWSFGCVLFEMLSGQRAFTGATQSDTLASLLTSEPRWDQLPPSLSPAITRLLRRCLDTSIAVFSPATGRGKRLIEGGFYPRYSPSGHIVYARAGSLFAVPFEANSQTVTGQPIKVLDGVMMSRNSGVANFDISTNGTLLDVTGQADGGARTLHAWTPPAFRRAQARTGPAAARWCTRIRPRAFPSQCRSDDDGPRVCWRPIRCGPATGTVAWSMFARHEQLLRRARPVVIEP